MLFLSYWNFSGNCGFSFIASITLREKTGCEITVGQNGLVWLNGTPEGELLAEKAIKLIEEKSHLEGLTERVEQFLGGQKLPERKTVSAAPEDA